MTGSPVSRLRRVLSGIGRLITAVFVLALAAGLVLAASWRPPASPGAIEPMQIDVGAAPLTLVCPPAPVLPTGDGGDLDYDDQFDTAGETTLADLGVVLGRDGAEPEPATGGSIGTGGSAIPAVGSLRLLTTEDPEPLQLQAEPSAQETAFAAGASLSRTDTGDLRGLTAAPCIVPTSSAWLVGGQTELGSSARLTLTNPGETAATVTVQAWGSVGPVEPVTLALEPGGVSSVLLEAVTLEPRLGVHVSSEGGRFTASIQETVLDGLVSQGSDVITAAADPSTELHVGPIPVLADAGTAVLRLLNPGEEPAEVSIDVLAEGVSTLSGTDALVIEPGTVADIALDGIDEGTAALRITSDQPVTGGALIVRQGGPSELDPDQSLAERAWLPATDPAGHGLLALPANGALVDEVALALTNPGTEDQTVAVHTVDADGQRSGPVEIRIPAGSTTGLGDLDVNGAVAVDISGTQVLATATLSATTDQGTMVGLLPMTPDAHSDQSVTVHVGTN
ncbi:DUF5719 family protein [Ruania rhizosphaerae]|uniref:DUF5719 family protein n=1 Tax=Ruania rhizosphaerae TaxID=1840413 RepID=UPI00135A3710|nr:DUF5719 family protein [Ruania rhizosphaerae]